jgi:ABC-type oligopeptide transport system ATPase subunit
MWHFKFIIIIIIIIIINRWAWGKPSLYNTYYIIIEYNPIVRILCDLLITCTRSTAIYTDAQYKKYVFYTVKHKYTHSLNSTILTTTKMNKNVRKNFGTQSNRIKT